MVTKTLFIASILLQLFVAILALRFISFTRIKVSWILISFGFLLMAFTRFIDFSAFLNIENSKTLMRISHWLGILTSIVIAAGVWLIRDLFYSLKIAEIEQKRSERKVLSAIMRTEERERRRFAEDIHDGLGPLLSTIKLYVNELTSEDVSMEEKKESITYINQLIDDAVSDIRTTANNLTPRVIHEYGLISAVDEFCNNISRTQKLNIIFEKPGKSPELGKQTEMNLYRIINELINNTLKHSGAKNVNVSFIMRKKNFVVKYSDDGRGFDYSTKNQKFKGEGLNNIITRVNSIDGKIKIISEEGKGFNATIDVPLKH